jgi:hypothetical protein
MPWSDPKVRAAYHYRYYRANKDKFRGYREKMTPAQWENHARTLRKCCLRRDYGITLEEYDAMLLAQNGCCYICKRHWSSFKKSLAVDHCHVSGKVRKLLCAKCNTAVGWYEKFAKTAETYLSEFKEPK